MTPKGIDEGGFEQCGSRYIWHPVHAARFRTYERHSIPWADVNLKKERMISGYHKKYKNLVVEFDIWIIIFVCNYMFWDVIVLIVINAIASW